eukprot:2906938-Alexandrium_andersonii.AAC.1
MFSGRYFFTACGTRRVQISSPWVDGALFVYTVLALGGVRPAAFRNLVFAHHSDRCPRFDFAAAVPKVDR